MVNSDFNMIVQPIFAKPLAKLKFETSDKITDFLIKQEVKEKESDSYGGVSKNVMILRDPILNELRDLIIRSTTEFAVELMGIDTEKMIDVCSWVTIKRPGQFHTTHYHPNSIISGVYFFDEHTENMPLIFEETTLSSNEFILRPKTIFDPEKLSKVPFPINSARKFNVERGDIVLFPSYIKHMVQMNTTPFNRYSLAFNMMTKESVGDAATLTFFNYGDAL